LRKKGTVSENCGVYLYVLDLKENGAGEEVVGTLHRSDRDALWLVRWCGLGDAFNGSNEADFALGASHSDWCLAMNYGIVTSNSMGDVCFYPRTLSLCLICVGSLSFVG
jgi:hypothetical protein